MKEEYQKRLKLERLITKLRAEVGTTQIQNIDLRAQVVKLLAECLTAEKNETLLSEEVQALKQEAKSQHSDLKAQIVNLQTRCDNAERCELLLHDGLKEIKHACREQIEGIDIPFRQKLVRQQLRPGVLNALKQKLFNKRNNNKE